MRHRTLALVETATQLHNVIEWAHTTASVDEIKVDVLAPTDLASKRQLVRVTAMARGVGLDVRYRSVRARNSAAATGLAAVSRDLAGARRLVLGDPFSRCIQTLLPLSRAEHVVVVDDGTATWEFVACLDEGKPMVRWRRPLHGAHHLGARTTRWIAPTTHRRLTVFSSLADATPLGASLARNRYAWTQRWRRPEVLDGCTDVLGVSLVDSGLVAREPYLNAVAELVRRHGPVRYLAHRRESDELLAAVGGIAGVTAVRSDLPAELALRKGPVARRVVAFPSTAAHTLPVVLRDVIGSDGVRVTVRPVDPEWFTPAATSYARRFVTRIGAVAPRGEPDTLEPVPL